MSDLFDFYPYAERFGVTRALPDSGRSREEILSELRTMASEEDAVWEDGRCSGTMYCGDRDHYAFLKEAFGLFAHQNALQRDMCPSATRFEGEIIAMALELLHAGAARRRGPGGNGHLGRQRRASPRPSWPIGSRGERSAGIERPNLVKPESGHPAFDKACHLFGVEMRRVPVDPETTLVRPDGGRGRWSTTARSRSSARPATTAMARSIRSPSSASWRSIAASACTSTAASAAICFPSGEELGYPHPAVRFPGPGCEQHLRRHPQVRLWPQGDIDAALPRPVTSQSLLLLHAGLERREVLLAGNGRVALRRPAGRHLGLNGLDRARRLSRVRAADLRDIGGDAGGGPLPSGAQAARRADLPLRASPRTSSTSTTSTTR